MSSTLGPDHSPWLLTHANGDAVNQQGRQIVEQNNKYRVHDRVFVGEKAAVPVRGWKNRIGCQISGLGVGDWWALPRPGISLQLFFVLPFPLSMTVHLPNGTREWILKAQHNVEVRELAPSQRVFHGRHIVVDGNVAAGCTVSDGQANDRMSINNCF